MFFFPAIFEFLGTTELLVIAVVALIIFGPRKLPEIGRTVGKSLAEFKRASEDFKRTWEREVELDRIERDMNISDEIGSLRTSLSATTAAVTTPGVWQTEQEAGQTIARAPAGANVAAEADTADEPGVPAESQGPGEPAPKHDWL